ncbi:hypothetical protein [Halosegnis sp.]|uniref:DUF7576 family protein n=1 Tax=Halosegnis sp. TaxID=2864959 RepID=UPI0035D4964F
MEDPTSDLAEDLSPEDAPNCRVCGASLADVPDRKVVTWIADGEVQTAHFCDATCRDEWDRSQ